MTLASNLHNLLKCPITGEQLQDAVVDPCGHTFEKVDIIHWLKDDPFCPLSRNPLTVSELKPNLLVKDVVLVLGRHNDDLNKITDDEKDVVDSASQKLLSQRTNDAAKGILAILPDDQLRPSLARRMKQGVKEFYGCT